MAKTKKIEEVSSKVFSEYWKDGNLSSSSQTIVRNSCCLESFSEWVIPEAALCCKRELVCPTFQLCSRGDGAVGLPGPCWKENAGDVQDSSWEMMFKEVYRECGMRNCSSWGTGLDLVSPGVGLSV